MRPQTQTRITTSPRSERGATIFGPWRLSCTGFCIALRPRFPRSRDCPHRVHYQQGNPRVCRERAKDQRAGEKTKNHRDTGCRSALACRCIVRLRPQRVQPRRKARDHCTDNLGMGQFILLNEWPLQATLGRMRMRAVAHSSTEAGFEPARLLRNSSRRSRHMDSTVLVVRGRPSCGCIR